MDKVLDNNNEHGLASGEAVLFFVGVELHVNMAVQERHYTPESRQREKKNSACRMALVERVAKPNAVAGSIRP